MSRRYRIEYIAPGIWDVTNLKNGNKHQVTLGENGLYHCADCPGWHHRKYCNHVYVIWKQTKDLWEANRIVEVEI